MLEYDGKKIGIVGAGDAAFDYALNDADVMGVYMMAFGDPNNLLPFDTKRGIPNQGIGIPNYTQPEKKITLFIYSYMWLLYRLYNNLNILGIEICIGLSHVYSYFCNIHGILYDVLLLDPRFLGNMVFFRFSIDSQTKEYGGDWVKIGSPHPR